MPGISSAGVHFEVGILAQLLDGDQNAACAQDFALFGFAVAAPLPHRDDRRFDLFLCGASDRCDCPEAIDNDTASGALGLQDYRGYVESQLALPPRNTCALRCGDASLGKLVGGGANGGRAPATQFRVFDDVGCQADLVAASAAVSVQACENAVDFHLHLDVPG